MNKSILLIVLLGIYQPSHSAETPADDVKAKVLHQAEVERMSAMCDNVNYVMFRKKTNENGIVVLERFIRLNDESGEDKQTYVQSCNLFGFAPEPDTEEVETKLAGTHEDPACRTTQEQLELATLLKLSTDLDPLVEERADCAEKDKTDFTDDCFPKFLNCGARYTMVGPLLQSFVEKPKEGAKNSCDISGGDAAKTIGKCFENLIAGLGLSVYQTAVFIKDAVKWAGNKMFNWNSNPEVIAAQDKMTEVGVIASKQTDVHYMAYAEAKWNAVKQFFSILKKQIADGIASNFGCADWEGLPHTSRCLKPIASWGCADCAVKTQMTCGVVSFLAAEGMLTTALAVGTGGAAAGVVAGMVAKAVGRSGLTALKLGNRGKYVRGIARASFNAASRGAFAVGGKIGKIVKTPFGYALAVERATLQTLGKVKTLAVIGKGIDKSGKVAGKVIAAPFRLDDHLTRQAFNFGWHGGKGTVMGGSFEAGRKAFRLAEANAAMNRYQRVARAYEEGKVQAQQGRITSERLGDLREDLKKEIAGFQSRVARAQNDGFMVSDEVAAAAARLPDSTTFLGRASPKVPSNIDEAKRVYAESFRAARESFPQLADKDVQEAVRVVKNAFKDGPSDQEIATVFRNLQKDGIKTGDDLNQELVRLKQEYANKYPELFGEGGILAKRFQDESDLVKAAYVRRMEKDGINISGGANPSRKPSSEFASREERVRAMEKELDDLGCACSGLCNALPARAAR